MFSALGGENDREYGKGVAIASVISLHLGLSVDFFFCFILLYFVLKSSVCVYVCVRGGGGRILLIWIIRPRAYCACSR